MTDEEFRTIPGFPDYKVSNKGTVVSYRVKKPRLLNGYIHTDKRTGKTYHKYTLQDQAPSNGETEKSVHLLMYEAFYGDIPENCYVCHINGNTLDNRLDNLQLLPVGVPSRVAIELSTKNKKIRQLRQTLQVLWNEIPLRDRYFLSNGVEDAVIKMLTD